MLTYARKTTILAQQFNSSVLPWPDGISADPGTTAGYVFHDSQGVRFPVRSGDYIAQIGADLEVISQADFEAEYQV